MLACSFVGPRQRVADGLSAFLERTGADEAIVAAAIYDHQARLRSYEIVAEAFGLISSLSESPA
jgi:alkanesulfonate monooxygenase SsuD/methylene tetrahydromethanopterin reductase-like flavin-dependent oxidoreductase (luciferase family)